MDQPVSDVERDLSQTLVSTALVTAQVAEAAVRMRQHAVEQQAAAHTRAAAAARAQRRADHAADRVRWSRAFDPDWLRQAPLDDLMRAWAAGARWDTDPAADAAARRVETRLADAAPNAMRDYQRRRATGAGRVEAMRAVGRDWDAEVTARADPQGQQRRTPADAPPPPAAAGTPRGPNPGAGSQQRRTPPAKAGTTGGTRAAATGVVIDRAGVAVPVFPRRQGVRGRSQPVIRVPRRASPLTRPAKTHVATVGRSRGLSR